MSSRSRAVSHTLSALSEILTLQSLVTPDDFDFEDDDEMDIDDNNLEPLTEGGRQVALAPSKSKFRRRSL